MNIPDKIYLQWYDDDGEEVDEVTWCIDQINETDVVYIRAEKAEADNAALRARVEELELQVALLTPSYTEVTITGSDHTNWDGEGIA